MWNRALLVGAFLTCFSGCFYDPDPDKIGQLYEIDAEIADAGEEDAGEDTCGPSDNEGYWKTCGKDADCTGACSTYCLPSVSKCTQKDCSRKSDCPAASLCVSCTAASYGFSAVFCVPEAEASSIPSGITCTDL